ncbi:DUF6056 family protein [Photobacterium nomapromontoriensis]|uniref:DUF6056 family protein n=1 Tax=Photobacterium nomapromontoriensis TaxID=2910237 RepID=UPI003D12D44B
MYSSLKNRYILTLALITLFIFFLNVLFPLISDDFCHLDSYLTYGGLDAAIRSYMTWNARTGEILAVLFGTHLIGLPFAIVNTLVFFIIFAMIHPLLFARKGETSRDGLFLIIFFSLLSISTVFGAVFLWRAGAMNYAWSLAFCMMHFTIYRYHYTGITSWYKSTNSFVIALFCLLSFIAGMSSFDLGALGCLIHFGFFVYRKITKKQESSLRFMLPVICFIAGFITLYTAPGTQVRVQSVNDYTSLGQILSWLLNFELPQLAGHYLDTLGRSMYKTNYLVALASIATTYFIITLQKQYHFIPFKRMKLLCGYLVAIIIQLGLLYLNSSKPSGDSLGATILFSNFLFSVIALIYLVKTKVLSVEQRSTALMFVFLYCLLIIDVSAYTVGVLPARRAYLTASVLASLILALFVQLKWKTFIQKCFFIPLFFISASFLTIETWGLSITNEALIIKPISALSVEDDFIIRSEQLLLKAPQFYDWSPLSIDKKNWANHCFVRFYNIKSISQPHEIEEVSITDYLDYLTKIKSSL